MALTVLGTVATTSTAHASTSTVPITPNPAMTQQCEIDLAIQLDYSTSMSAAQLTAQEDAIKDLADALLGYPVRIALFNFGSNSPLNGTAANAPLALTSVATQSGVDAIHAKLDAFNRPGTQYTNWQAAINAVSESLPAGESYDALALVTDGNPTRSTTPELQNTSDTPVNQQIVDAGVTTANALKAKGTRIIGVAMTDNLNSSGYAAMLRQMPQVSGPTQGSDFYVNGISALQQTLLDIVNTNCATIDLDKVGTLSSDGDTITYDFVVRNTGIVSISDITLTDPLPGLSSITWGAWPDPATPGVLEPTEQVTATATYAVTSEDRENGNVHNVALASGLPPTGTTRVSDEGTNDQPLTPVTPPVTDAGTSSGLPGVPQSFEPTPTAGSAPIDWGTLTLLDGSGTPVSTLTINPAQGTYTVSGDTLVFTPADGFVGTATPANYRISDENGQHAQNTYTPRVVVSPIAVDDSSEGPWNTDQSVDPLTNDDPGEGSDGFDLSSLTLLDADGDPATTVTVPEGEYSIEEGRIVFSPNEDYCGPVTPVEYRVADANGTTASSTYTPEIVVAQPSTNIGATSGPQGLPQSWEPTPVAGEDFAIVWSTLTLADGSGNPVPSITADGEGVYTVVGDEIVFTPEPQFVGEATTVPYRISDAGGQHANGTFTPTIIAVIPIAENDASTGWWNTPQSVDPLANDAPGHPDVPLDPATLTLLDGDGEPADEVTVPEGVYTVDRSAPEAPRIVFTPNRGFIGTPTPVDYRIEDANGTPAEAVYQPFVRGPEATEDFSQTKVCGTAVDFTLTTEVDGLDAGSVRLVDADGNPVTELAVAGEGTWKVDTSTGKVTFTPSGCFVGKVTPVQWEGRLGDGTPVTGTLSVEYTEKQENALTTTGGPALLGLAGLGALLVAAGAVLMVRRRREA